MIFLLILTILHRYISFIFRSIYYCPSQQLDKLHWLSETLIMAIRKSYCIENLYEEIEFKLSEVKKEDQKVNVQVFTLKTYILCIYSRKSFEVPDLLLKRLSNYKVGYVLAWDLSKIQSTLENKYKDKFKISR